MKFTHRMLSGEDVEAETSTSELTAFLNRLREAVDDPGVSEARFLEMLYSTENPLLDRTVMPGYGTVTRAVFADPLYHVMTDLLGRKRVALGSLDLKRVAARYSMTVKDAAAKLGISEGAVRQAIAAHRLSSFKIGGAHQLDPQQVANYRVNDKGPAAPLDIWYGSLIGSLSFAAVDGEARFVGPQSQFKKHIQLSGWTSVAILAGIDGKDAEKSVYRPRFWRLEPGPEKNWIGVAEFRVEGRFAIVEQVNNPREAQKAFDQAKKFAKAVGTFKFIE